MILMTLVAAAFSGFFRGALWTMALLAGLNARQKDVCRFAAVGSATVARGAGHHAMGMMIEIGM